MKFAGIIAEYDPFHNGHAWQLAQAKALGAERVAVAMSCSLVQRGALPLLPEAVRTRSALTCGADLVFALPAPCAGAGAEAFARAGVALLAAAGCDGLVFGAETPDAALLMEAAELLDSGSYRAALHLTEKGIEVARQVNQKVNLAVFRAGDGLSDADREIFYTALGRICANLKLMSKEGL